ncbi:NUT domain-containing protein [Podarcis lilfordi]|uniref:NUT domain-containing protein n=1 Tax=Podarcis lilfordi TaxID=74358 RepID=A0AA35PJE0_9SAUR|nr:NUT domain-containing protein [Podarcis lilfordi]
MASQAHTPGPAPPSCPPSAPSLLLPAFPGTALLVTSADAPGSKLIIKLKREGPMMGGAEEIPRTQTFFLTGMPLGWATQRRDGPAGPGIRTVLLAKAGEEPGGRKQRVPEAMPSARAPPPSDASFACTSKGVYENYRRWQRYKALARRHFPATPDAEALACFFIPVLRSLARLRPDMTLEDGVPRAVQEWEHSSNFERMIFYEMAEKFMEFEAEEEQQIQKMKLLASCAQFQAPAPKPNKPPPSPAPESGQQQVYIPKKSASKSRQPRRRQRRPPSTSTPGAPREIPAEAVHQYAEIMEGLDTSWEEEEDEKKEQGVCSNPQEQEEGAFPDPALLQYIDQLCDDEEFVCKVEAVIHPQFMADLLSPEKSQDPLDLMEELAEELNLTPNQLTEKRLLALSEEEREPSVYPTSHSDSTPSQSEEEDEVSGNGKGEDASCHALKRPLTSKVIRSNQPELPVPATSSPLAHHSQQRGFPPKVESSPHKCGIQDSQEANLLLSLKSTVEEETQNSQGRGQVQSHGSSSHSQWATLEATPGITGNASITGNLTSEGDNKAKQGIARPHALEHSKQDGGQEGKVKQHATGQGSLAVKGQFHNGMELVWNNLEPPHNKCEKQDGIQRGEVKCLKKAHAIWKIQEDDPKGTDHDRQGLNKMLLEDGIAAERTLRMTLNGHGGQNVDSAEKARGQLQVQSNRGLKEISSRRELDCQGNEMTSHPDNQIKQELLQAEREKLNGCQGEVAKDQLQSQGIYRGAKPTSNVTVTQFGGIKPCGKSSAVQDSLALSPSGRGNHLNGQETQVKSQKKPEANWKQMATKSVKDNGLVKSVQLPADNISLDKQPISSRQDGQQSIDSPVLETDEGTKKSHVEPSQGNKQKLTLSNSSWIGLLEEQPTGTDSEHVPYFTLSVLEPQSPSIQKCAEIFQKSQWPLTDQCKVTPWVENLPDDKQNPESTPNPSSYVATVEADGGSCSPAGAHTPVAASSGKGGAAFPLSQGGGSSGGSHGNDEPSQRSESSDLLPSKAHRGLISSESNAKNPSKGEGGDLLERVSVAKDLLPELPGGSVEDILKYGAKEDDEEEDEELSSFSSLLASKLSLSPHSALAPLTREQGDTLSSSPTDAGKQGAKTRHSTRAQVPQNSTTPPNRSPEASTATQHSHKRKNNGSGTRRSKRLRNQ